jgi:hypothetical protein
MRALVINLVVWVAVTLAGASLARSETVTLAWDASASAGVAGYRVYYGTNSRAYFGATNAGLARTQAVVLPRAGRWFFTATAYATNGMESAWSNEVQWESKPVAPVLHGEAVVRLTPVIDRSTNLVDWVRTAGEATFFGATNAAEFFRTRRLVIERVQRAVAR